MANELDRMSNVSTSQEDFLDSSVFTEGEVTIFDILDQKPEYNKNYYMTVSAVTYKKETGTFTLQTMIGRERVTIFCYPDIRIGVSITEEEVNSKFLNKKIYIKGVVHNEEYRNKKTGKVIPEMWKIKYLNDSIEVLGEFTGINGNTLKGGYLSPSYSMNDYLTVDSVTEITEYLKKDEKTNKWGTPAKLTEVYMQDIVNGKIREQTIILGKDITKLQANSLLGKKVKFNEFTTQEFGRNTYYVSKILPEILGETKSASASVSAPKAEVKSEVKPEQK